MLGSESVSILLDEEAGTGSSLLRFRLNLPDLSVSCATSEGRIPGNICCLGVQDVSESGLIHLLAPSPMFAAAAVVVTAPPTPPTATPTPPDTAAVPAAVVAATAVAALVLLRVVPTSSFSSSSP